MNSFEKLKTKLAELFQLDQADLDFGIYRIMNARRDEINRFLESDLLPQVREAFDQYHSADKTVLKKDLKEAEQQASELGVEPDSVPKVQELRAKYKTSGVDVTALENEVFDHLYSFFSRYYDEGDFISLRRYKEGVYAIPYEGEEVKLYWANQDQYYVKTTEYFRDYAFWVGTGRPGDKGTGRVHFKIVGADTEKDNIKAANGNDRRFLLHGDKPVIEENGELIIRFEYRPDGEKRRQDAINADTARRVIADLDDEKLAAWKDRLAVLWKRAGGKESDKTILDKHLFDYTRRNTFDYFIHKDLDGFLRRELDFYIKNEVMRLDDIEEESAPRVEQYLSKIKVIRRIAHKIIDFLAQIENFQKKLWLKKKFVVETNYCVTLDRVPEEMYPQISQNKTQIEEWVKLGFVEEKLSADYADGRRLEEEKNLFGKNLRESAPSADNITVEVLKANDKLVLDTKFFDDDFKARLIASIDTLDEQCDGVLVHSENFQALTLMQERYREQVKCVYIDPPYNAQSSEILYKNTYKHSSWLTLIEDRARAVFPLYSKTFVHVTAIDEVENFRLGMLFDRLYPNCEDACISIVHNPTGQQGNNFSFTHEFAHFIFPKGENCIGLEERKDVSREANPDIRPLRNVSSGKNHLRVSGANCFYPIYVKDGKIIGFGEVCDENFHPTVINQIGDDGVIEVYPIDPQGIESKWVFARNTVESIIDELSVEFNENKSVWDIIRKKSRFRYKSLWEDKRYSANSWGSVVLNSMLPGNPFTYPKSIYTVRDCVDAALNNSATGIVLDYFAGSGTTAHAVINLNREDGGKRKYILVEMGDYFNTVLKPRIQKVIYSENWKDGKPNPQMTQMNADKKNNLRKSAQSADKFNGISHMFKYIRLESYEDALANIKLQRTAPQRLLLEKARDFRESYMLKYMLDVESKGSRTLLNIDNFDDPWNYKLLVGAGSVGETKPVNADLVETFNWLLGLKVRHMDSFWDGETGRQGDKERREPRFCVVEGENPKGEKVLVIWRKIRDLSEDTEDDGSLSPSPHVSKSRERANRDLEVFFRKQQYNTLDSEFDVIYVNGDNNLMNVPLDPDKEGVEPRYKVRLIEEEFKRLMFVDN